MLTSVILAVTFAASHQGEAQVTPKGLIEKMLMRYATAKSLDGTVTLNQSAQGVTVTTQTQIAYEKPSKVLISQRRAGSSPKYTILVSNGEKFFFTRPEQVLSPNDFLGEYVKPDNRPGQTVGDLYAIAAAELADRSPVLDLLVARVPDMTYCMEQLRSLDYAGKVQIGSRSVHEIKGKWKENKLLESNVGDYELYVSDDGDLVRYVLRQKYAIPGGNSQKDYVEVTNTWDAAISVNSPVSADKFALRVHN